jgi:hypothetical protein
MSMPELISADNFAPLVPDATMLHEMACEITEKMFVEHGEMPPLWVIATGTRILTLSTPWDGQAEKIASQQLVRCLLEALGAQAYAFACEVWTAMVRKKGDSAEAEVIYKAKMAWIDEHGVAALPPEEREEIVYVTSQGREKGVTRLSRYLINAKRRRKTPWLGPRIDEDMEGGHTEGRMFDLFRQSPPPEYQVRLARALLERMQARMMAAEL